MDKDLERKRYFAAQNHEENEKGAKRYFDLVRGGRSEAEAREVVKAAFGWGDRRLDKVLTTRASAFGPGTIAEFEAIAANSIRCVEMAAKSEIRFYYQQLEDIDDLVDGGETRYEVKYTEGESSKLGFNWKSEKLPIREAQALLLQKISEASLKPISALKMFKADTIINLKVGEGLSSMSLSELETLEAELKKQKIAGTRETSFSEMGVGD